MDEDEARARAICVYIYIYIFFLVFFFSFLHVNESAPLTNPSTTTWSMTVSEGNLKIIRPKIQHGVARFNVRCAPVYHLQHIYIHIKMYMKKIRIPRRLLRTILTSKGKHRGSTDYFICPYNLNMT